MSVVNLSENEVKQLLDWSLVCDAAEQAFRSVSEVQTNNEQPTSKQPARSHTVTDRGIFLQIYINWIFYSKKTTSILNNHRYTIVHAGIYRQL